MAIHLNTNFAYTTSLRFGMNKTSSVQQPFEWRGIQWKVLDDRGSIRVLVDATVTNGNYRLSAQQRGSVVRGAFEKFAQYFGETSDLMSIDLAAFPSDKFMPAVTIGGRQIPAATTGCVRDGRLCYKQHDPCNQMYKGVERPPLSLLPIVRQLGLLHELGHFYIENCSKVPLVIEEGLVESIPRYGMEMQQLCEKDEWSFTKQGEKLSEEGFVPISEIQEKGYFNRSQEFLSDNISYFSGTMFVLGLALTLCPKDLKAGLNVLIQLGTQGLQETYFDRLAQSQ